jgi:hypothetical protein
VARALFGSAPGSARPGRVHRLARATRRRHLQRITNNTRFLVMPGLRWRTLPVMCWADPAPTADGLRRKYAEPVSLVETFVDTEPFRRGVLPGGQLDPGG